jgi:hypothetical protein
MSTPYKLFITRDPADSSAPTTNGVAVSGANTYYSKMWGGFGSTEYDLQVTWTGTPAGTLTLQVSDKPNPDESDDDDWVTTTETTMVDPAGAAAGFRVATDVSPGKKRLKYVNSAGSGVLYAHVIVPRVK